MSLFQGAGVANFAGVIKIAVVLIKATFKDSIKVKRIGKHLL